MLITSVGSVIERELNECADRLGTRACNHYGPGQPCSKPRNGDILRATARLRQIAREGGPVVTIAEDLLDIARDLVQPHDRACVSGWCDHSGCHDRLKVGGVLRDITRRLLQAAIADGTRVKAVPRQPGPAGTWP